MLLRASSSGQFTPLGKHPRASSLPVRHRSRHAEPYGVHLCRFGKVCHHGAATAGAAAVGHDAPRAMGSAPD
jgi:hypothetical protein